MNWRCIKVSWRFNGMIVRMSYNVYWLNDHKSPKIWFRHTGTSLWIFPSIHLQRFLFLSGIKFIGYLERDSDPFSSKIDVYHSKIRPDSTRYLHSNIGIVSVHQSETNEFLFVQCFSTDESTIRIDRSRDVCPRSNVEESHRTSHWFSVLIGIDPSKSFVSVGLPKFQSSHGSRGRWDRTVGIDDQSFKISEPKKISWTISSDDTLRKFNFELLSWLFRRDSCCLTSSIEEVIRK